MYQFLYLTVGYHRTVVVLWHQSQDFDILLQVGGIGAGIARLGQVTNPPSDLQKQLAEHLLGFLSTVPSPSGKEAARTIANAAAVWNDLDMWLRMAALGGAGREIHILGAERHLQALKTFSFVEPLRALSVFSYIAWLNASPC